MGGVVVRRVNRAPLEADHHMGLAERLLDHDLAAAIGGGRGRRRLAATQRLEVPGAEIDDFRMVDSAGAGDDRRAGLVMAAQVAVDRFAIE